MEDNILARMNEPKVKQLNGSGKNIKMMYKINSGLLIMDDFLILMGMKLINTNN